VGIELVLALLLLAGNAFFVAVEFSVARLRPTQIAQFERERRPGAKAARHAVEHIDAYLAACQLGITICSLGLGALGEPAFEDLIEPLLGEGAVVGGVALSVAVSFLLITVLHVVVGELSPKSLAIARTAQTALLLAPPMRVFYLVTRPLVDVFNWMGNILLKPFGIPPASEAGHAPHSEDELRELLRESSRQGLIEREEARFTENVLLFGDRRAREVMRPRRDVDVVRTDESLEDAARKAIASGCRSSGPRAGWTARSASSTPRTCSSRCSRGATRSSRSLRGRSCACPSRCSPTSCCASCAAAASTSRWSSTSTARRSGS
jgi:CBS domain containing-hemolysin-like protein